MRAALRTLTFGTAALVTIAVGAPAASAAPQPPAHLVIIFMENHSLSQTTGDPADMPYLNSLWNTGGERFTQYSAVTSSSFPNYAALFSGQALSSSNLSPGKRGDAWLSALVPKLTAVSGTLVVITFDEGGHLYAVATGAGITPGTADSTPYNHYSLLAYIEDAYQLQRLGNAANVTAMNLP
jgi:hypothetical protein